MQAEDPQPATARSPDRSEVVDVDDLRALPYLSFSEQRADTKLRGVVQLDRRRSQLGYNLYTGSVDGKLQLLSATGRAVHSWEIPHDERWIHASLTAGGDLVVIGGRPRDRTNRRSEEPRRRLAALPPRGTEPAASPTAGEEAIAESSRFLQRVGWRGELRWRRSLSSHHDIELLGDGRIVTLSSERRSIASVDPEIAVSDNYIEMFSPMGEHLDRASVYELLSSNPSAFRWRKVEPRQRRRSGRESIDLLHVNNLDWIELPERAGEHPIYRPGSVLITLRHQDAVAVVHWPTRKVVWSWGRDELSGPHHGQVLESGHLLIFDNGLERGSSRVIEMNPITETIVWRYEPPREAGFFTRTGGGCQRLSNGNTLIVSTNQGRAIEVTPAGDVVWEFFNPHIGERERRGVLMRLQRYGVDFIQALLREFRNQRG